MADRTIDIRAGLKQLFISDLLLRVLIGDPPRVYVNVPKDKVLPYVRIGDDAAGDFGTKTEQGQEIEITLHCYDQSPINRGQKKINQIQARFYALLHEQPVLGAFLVRFKSQHTSNDDGLSWHGVSRFRVLIWGTPYG